jgi:hypothetical protein
MPPDEEATVMERIERLERLLQTHLHPEENS